MNNQLIYKNTKTTNKSPLRYPGGKTRACKKLDLIIIENFNMSDFDNIISPFFGGGSFEFYIQNKYQLHIFANDKFTPLYHFWKCCKLQNDHLCKELTEKLSTINKEVFIDMRDKIMNESDILKQSIMFFIINRCSFSGATLSGGFSGESAIKRFTQSSISKIQDLNLKNFTIQNLDFEEFINNHSKHSRNIFFLDPPYYLEKGSKLYGKSGDMHQEFNHKKLYDCISTKKNWMMTYNNCQYIRELYKDFKIIETNWSYSMNKSKESSEIVIISK